MSRKKALLSEPKAGTAAPQGSTNDDTRPRRERLKTSVLEELWTIWRTDPRVPSIKSRRLWAISRHANPRLVDNWFLRRRMCARKAGTPIQDSSYDLPLDAPIPPKRERSASPIEPELETIPDLPSDDTLAYPPDVDDLNEIEASSDTAFDDDTLLELKRPQTPAYKEVPADHSEPKPSSASLYAVQNGDTLLENISFPICNQGRGKLSNFTCILCSSESAQDTIRSDSSTMSDSRRDSVLYSRLEFSPSTLSELSAIPFLFRTPPTVPPDNAFSRQSVDNWTTIDDELGRLVNDGKLDFSFLDVPHLSSMELID